MRNPGSWQNAAALSRAARRLEPAGEEIVGAECREQSRSLADVEVFSLDIPFNRTADQSSASSKLGQRTLSSVTCVLTVCFKSEPKANSIPTRLGESKSCPPRATEVGPRIPSD